MTKTSIIRLARPIYKVVGDGGLSHKDLGEGRFLPALIINAEPRSEVDDLIEIHQNAVGDAILQWSRNFSLFRPTHVTLEIKFQKPMEMRFGIEFDLKTQAILVDGIIQSRGLYIQRGVEGDKVSDSPQKKVLIEVPEVGFDIYWENLFKDIVKRKVDKNGKSKKDINQEITARIEASRTMWHFRRK